MTTMKGEVERDQQVPRGPDDQPQIDARNAEFWNELCGSSLARSLGISEWSQESLARFDEAYMSLYPYLPPYVTREALSGRPVLEVGLGYGTLAQLIMEQGCVYHGLDIAEMPVRMAEYRLRCRGEDPGDRVRVGSVLDAPFADESFDFVYSIGCLHHTANLARAVDEVHRVLKPGGKAIVMLYNRNSYRQMGLRVRWWARRLRNRGLDVETEMRRAYDANAAGEAAPHTDYVSKRDVRRLFGRYRRIRISVQNMDPMLKGRIPREALLGNLARIVGLDLYIVASK